MRAVLMLMALSSFATGCFTAGGAVVGARHRITVTSDAGEPEDKHHAIEGALVGLALDAIAFSLIATAFKDSYFENAR